MPDENKGFDGDAFYRSLEATGLSPRPQLEAGRGRDWRKRVDLDPHGSRPQTGRGKPRGALRLGRDQSIGLLSKRPTRRRAENQSRKSPRS